MAQSIDLSGEFGEIAVTLSVTRTSPDLLGESMGCVRCVLPTAVSRLKEGSPKPGSVVTLDSWVTGKEK
jgi:hypothetical protein